MPRYGRATSAAKWVRRSLLCIVLGFATAWVVAWGIEIAGWVGWVGVPRGTAQEGVAVIEPWLLDVRITRYRGSEMETWDGSRLDREYPGSDLQRRDAERVLEVGGAAHAEISYQEMLDFLPEAERMLNKPAGSMTEQHLDWAAKSQRVTRVDDQIGSLLSPELEVRLAATRADSFMWFVERAGWPRPMLESLEGLEFTWVGPSPQQSDVSERRFEIPAMTRSPVPGVQPVALSLPLGVIPGAAVTNTLFYGGSWLALITGLELLRSLRRHLTGRCIGCGYSLRGAAGMTCPECGRTKRR